jgi:hypothetical protein
VLIFKQCMTNFEKHQRFSKSVAIGDGHVNIS